MPASSIRIAGIAYPILSTHPDHMCLEGVVTAAMVNTCYREVCTHRFGTGWYTEQYWYIAIVNADIPSFVLLPCAQPNDGEFAHRARMTEDGVAS